MTASMLAAMFGDIPYQPRGSSSQTNDRRVPMSGSSINIPARLKGGAFSVDNTFPNRFERKPLEACGKLQMQQQLLLKEIPMSCHNGGGGNLSVVASASRYKTEMCRPFEETGHCRYGFKCQFAHGAHELRNLNRHPKYKTELCRTFHSTGFCSYGQRCNFIHNDDERLPENGGLDIRRPRALSIMMGSAGDSPASSISGDSPSSSPSYLSDDMFPGGRGAGHFFPNSPTLSRSLFSAANSFTGLESSLPDSGFSDDFGAPPSPVPSCDDYSPVNCMCGSQFHMCKGLHLSLFDRRP